MTATTEPTGDGPLRPAGSGLEPSAPLIGTSSSYRCSSCAADLAVDQHYCVECGTRRGSPRFTLAAPMAPSTALTTATSSTGLPTLPATVSPRVTALLAAVVVLFALGVGVLIGESGNTVKVSTVTIGAATSASGAAKTPTASGTSSTPASGSKTSTSSSGSGSGSGYTFGN